nr:glycine cleavage system aminomethyltransferase GcvT [uncultured Actinomyces sp.]
MSQMTVPVLRTTPLHSVHAAAGAFFTDADGWRMPLRYSCAPTEHRAVRTSAGIFDLSHMGEIKVTGPGAAAALDRALVGRVSTVALGRSLRTMMVTGAGGVIDVLMVHHVGEHEYMVVSGAGNRKRVVAELARRRDGHACTIDDISTATALITVQGPRTTEVLSGAVESGAGIPAALHPRETGSPTDGGDCGPDVLCGSTLLRRLRRHAAVRATAAGHSVLLARAGCTGEDGFELFCGAEDAVDLWTVITGHAATLPARGRDDDGRPLPVLTPCGLAARESLRLEAGVPLHGHELTESITPWDASAGDAVDLDKPDFIGRRALAVRAGREEAAGTTRLVALIGRGRCAARAGDGVFDLRGRRVGAITSGLLSPTLGRPIALALLAPASPEEPAWATGTTFNVEAAGGRTRPMEVVTAPFYRRTQ